MENKSYQELEVWKESRVLVKMVYQISSKYPDVEKFGLTLQVRRSAVSVVSNIAEGVGRNTSKDTLQFLYIAKGSVYELETQLLISTDLSFVLASEIETTLAQISLVKKLLFGFIKYKSK